MASQQTHGRNGTTSELWYGSLFASPDPAALLDARGRLTAANPALEGLVADISRPELAAYMPADGRNTFQEALAEVVTSGAAQRFDVPLRTRGGPRRMACTLYTIDRTEHGHPRLCLQMRDVTERRLEEERLRRSEQLMIDTEGTAHLGTWDWDITQPHAHWSDQLHKIYGLDPATHIPTYEDYLTRVHPDDVERVKDVTNKAFHEHIPYSHDERIFRSDGEMRYLHTWAQPVLDDEGHLVRLVGVCQDITERKRAEQEVEKRLHEQEVLLQEVHHRVKNNLQVISSLLRLQADRTQDRSASTAILESSNRVRSMSLVHENLYESGDLAHLDFPSYMQRLVNDAMRAYGANQRNVRYALSVDKVSLPIDNAVALGLLANELVSNALKHAFPGNHTGHVNITLEREGGDAVLTVQDDGIGLPKDVVADHGGSLGMDLVRSFTKRLGGTLHLETNGGTCAEVRFPVPESDANA